MTNRIPLCATLGIAALLCTHANGQSGWTRVYPDKELARDAVIVGWDAQKRMYVWDVGSEPKGIFWSEDGAATWKHETWTSPATSSLFSHLTVAPDGSLYAIVTVTSPAAEYGVFKSSDKGKTWTKVKPKGNLNLTSRRPVVLASGDIFFYSKAKVSDSKGFMYHSADGGATWDSSATDYCGLLSTDPKGRFWNSCTDAANPNGQLRWSEDKGKTWTLIKGGVGGYSLNTDLEGVALMGDINHHVLVTTGSADSLKDTQASEAGGDIHGVAAVSASEYIAASNGSGIYRTTDKGATWNRFGGGMKGTDSGRVKDLRRGPDGRIYAATDGFIYAYGTAIPDAVRASGRPARTAVESVSDGWILRTGAAQSRIAIRALDGRLVRRVRTGTDGSARLSRIGLPSGLLIAEFAADGVPMRVKLFPR